MKNSHIPIVLGYVLILILIGVIGYAYYNEEHTLAMTDNEIQATNDLRRDINNLNMRLSALSLMGETAVEWTDGEREDYHRQRMLIDSTLCRFGDIFPSDRADIDSLRILLEDKEEKLGGMAEIYSQQKSLGEEMANRLPVIVRQSAAEEPKKAKRKGFLGIFGKKEDPKPTATTTMLYSFNRDLMAQRKTQSEILKARADSLSVQNRILNRRIQGLLSDFYGKTQDNLLKREQEIAATRAKSYRDIGVLTAIVLSLLLLSYVIIHRDTRRRERGKLELEESIRQNNSLLEMRKKIILTISHDIRGPLNVISGSAELAIDTRDKKKRDGYLNNARYLCRHVVHLLNNLLDIYRLNEAKETPNNIPFRLDNLLGRIATGAAQVINDKGLLFIHDFRDTEVTVSGDEDRIEQIADNLLSNAVKFTRSGTVGFNASYSDGHLLMEVSDTGIGMTKETIERIFHPFERADGVGDVEGFGLGLSITKGQVSLLGGTIDVASEVGKGTTFHVAIPLSQTDGAEVADIPARASVERLHLPRNVMVIDDDPLQRDIVREMLERNSVSCTACATASEVVKAMRERDYDILLTDINMPGTNGFALLELLRKSSIGNSRTIPVIAMTARDDDENKPLLRQGFSGCIFKPFSMQELLERISAISAKPGTGASAGIDLSPLTSTVSDRGGILRSLSASTRKDLADLRNAATKTDRKSLAALLHRIWPMWELLRIDDRLVPLKTALKDPSTPIEDIRTLCVTVAGIMEIMIEKAREEIETLKHEKQDTYS